MRKLLIAFGLALSLVPATFFLSLQRFSLFGWYINQNPDTLAQRIVSEERTADDCLRLLWIEPAPHASTEMMRAMCVREVARLRSDPSACLLLPSDAFPPRSHEAFPCLKSIVRQALDSLPGTGSVVHCSGTGKTFNCHLYHGDVLQQTVISHENCSAFTNSDDREVCRQGFFIAQDRIESCTSLTNQRLREECLFALDRTCTKMNHPTLQQACAVREELRQHLPCPTEEEAALLTEDELRWLGCEQRQRDSKL